MGLLPAVALAWPRPATLASAERVREGKLACLEAAGAGLDGEARGHAKREAAQRWAALSDASRLAHQQRALAAPATAPSPQAPDAPRTREGQVDKDYGQFTLGTARTY